MSCPTCGGLVPSHAIGRPSTYCSVDCRREMAARRRELAILEDELAEARERLHAERWKPGRDHFWTETIKFIEARISAQRPRVTSAYRPAPGIPPVARRGTRYPQPQS